VAGIDRLQDAVEADELRALFRVVFELSQSMGIFAKCGSA